jgi:inorganic pyrophosphatase
MNSTDFIGKILTVHIDRQLGSKHPTHDYIYKLNYGYIPGTIANDGEEIDAYILGISEPVASFTGRCIAVIHRLDDNEDKVVVAPDGRDYSDDQIREMMCFQEQYFKSIILR